MAPGLVRGQDRHVALRQSGVRLLVARRQQEERGTTGTAEEEGAETLGSVAGRLWEDLGFLEPEEARRALRRGGAQPPARAALADEPRRRRIVTELLGLQRDPGAGSCATMRCGMWWCRRSMSRTRCARVRSSSGTIVSRTSSCRWRATSCARRSRRSALYAEVLKRLLTEDEHGPDWKRKMQEAVSKFQSQITHIARLTDDLVDVARLESERLSIERKPVDLKSVLVRVREQSVAASAQPPVKLTLRDQPRQGDGQRRRGAAASGGGQPAQQCRPSRGRDRSDRLELECGPVRWETQSADRGEDSGPGSRPRSWRRCSRASRRGRAPRWRRAAASASALHLARNHRAARRHDPGALQGGRRVDLHRRGCRWPSDRAVLRGRGG